MRNRILAAFLLSTAGAVIESPARLRLPACSLSTVRHAYRFESLPIEERPGAPNQLLFFRFAMFTRIHRW